MSILPHGLHRRRPDTSGGVLGLAMEQGYMKIASPSIYRELKLTLKVSSFDLKLEGRGDIQAF